MLTSLFGDLGPPKGLDARRRHSTSGPDDGFAATAILESVATEVNARGQMIDRHSHDLVVTGSPAQAIREHFAESRADLETATSLITLLDPAGVWASAVIKALSDAGGRPIERLHLRERSTLRTLATIERTTLVRRHEDTLRIYYPDVRAPGRDTAEIPVALMERSQMTTVIAGPQQPHEIDAMLADLYAAAMLATWRCPNVLFMLPPNAAWISSKISAIPWPGRLHVHVLNESMTGASSVWNAMLRMWNHVKSQPGWEPSSNPPLMGMNEFPIRVSDLGDPASVERTTVAITGPGALFAAAAPKPAVPAAAPPVLHVSRGVLDLERARSALAGMLSLDGLLGCAVVDLTTGLVLAGETRDQRRVDIDLAAAACVQVMRVHRQAARRMGLTEQIDEVMASVGSIQQLMRTVSRYPDLFLLALLDKHRTSLALARFQLMDVESRLK